MALQAISIQEATHPPNTTNMTQTQTQAVDVPVEDKVQEVVNSLLRSGTIEEAFSGYIVQTTANKRMRKESTLDLAKKCWESLPKESHEAGLKYYVNCVHAQTNSRRVTLLLEVLEGLVTMNVLPARMVCEALLGCERLTYTAADKWCQTFLLVKSIIKGVDYKGSRDFLKLMLEKTQELPTSGNVHILQVLDAIYEVITYILDRDNCLLPGYFAVNEITRMFSENKAPWPHWKLGQLLADYVQSFRPAAQLVTAAGKCQMLPVVGHSSNTSSSTNVWKLQSSSLKFPLSGPLPYDKTVNEPQTHLLRYVLEQPYSRDMVCSMLGLIKQPKQWYMALEEQLVALVISAMERSETEDTSSTTTSSTGGSTKSSIQALWQHLSSQLIYFVLFQFANFPHMVTSMYEKLKGQNLMKGRDHLMWVLLQFISGSISKTPLDDFLPVMKLYDVLYPEQKPLPIPECSLPSATIRMAATCIWIHLNKKAQNIQTHLHRPIPHALSGHIEYLKQCSSQGNIPNLAFADYNIALLCNAFSTNSDFFLPPITKLINDISLNNNTVMLPGNQQAVGLTQPLPLSFLDSLTVHTKMSLIHRIVSLVVHKSTPKVALALAPALVETYSRLLVYMEIESLGMKGFISNVLPSAIQSNAWGTVHTLLEMFSCRIYHIQPHYWLQLLSQLHQLGGQTTQNQLHLCVESTALRLIMGFGSWEVQPQLSRVEPKSMLASESEEINRALILTLARAIHGTGSESVAGTWCKDILTTIKQRTPHRWSNHTLECFPPALSEFFKENQVEQEDTTMLKSKVEAEYRKWKSMVSENELIAHFLMQGSPPLFLCVLWKSLLDDNRISPTALKVLERLGPRVLASHVRTFADYLVFEFSTSHGSHVHKCVESLNNLIWKCNVVPIDRLILCMALRPLDDNEAQVCSLIIQLLLLKHPDFRNRVQEFVKENSPEHWLQNNWHEKHMAFHQKFPEKFHFEGLQDATQPPIQHQYLPIYFSNVCLRFLPVFDIVIHRFLELKMGPVTKSLELLLEHLGGLYKFHDRPVMFLYNTLHYYEKKLWETSLKKKLVHAIIGSLKDIRPPNWCLSEDYLQYLNRSADRPWIPDQGYYVRLISRLVDTISDKTPSPFADCDWRFNEFPNLSAHALYVTCVELMALPVLSQSVGAALIDIILKGSTQVSRDRMMEWMNAIALVLTALPSSYWMILLERIIETMTKPQLANPPPNSRPFHAFSFSRAQPVAGESHCSYVLALSHAVWQHASIGQLSCIPAFMREKVRPIVKTEDQYLFVCHLFGPFLQRFYSERTKCLMDLTIELYEMLLIVDKNVQQFRHIDAVSDFLYHIKYMYVGHGVKNEIERIIGSLRPQLQFRLRFISHQGKEEGAGT